MRGFVGVSLIFKLLFTNEYRATGRADPDPFCIVELPGQPRWVTDDHRIRGKAPRDEGIRGDHAVSAEHELSLVTYDCCTMSDPTPLLDSNRTAGRGTLRPNRQAGIFIGVIMIHDERARRHHDVALDVDTVLGRDYGLRVDNTTVFNNNLDTTFGVVEIERIDPSVIPDNYRIPDANAWRHSPA